MKSAGYDSLHVRDIRMSTASDREIFKRAKDDGRVVITADTDFGALFFMSETKPPSVVIFRTFVKKSHQERFSSFIQNFLLIEGALDIGSVVIFEEGRIRIKEYL